MEKYYLIAYGAFILVMSLIAFSLYGADKRKAKKGAWRIPEAVLLNFGFFGGAVGALFAMRAFRHKTKHWYFWVVNILGLIWQIALPVIAVRYWQGIL